jgi:hypothetical protein
MYRVVYLSSLVGLVLGASMFAYGLIKDVPPAEAAVEVWEPGRSWVQEIPSWMQNIKPLGYIESNGTWYTHYNNAVGAWNGYINDDPFWWAQSWEYGHVHVLESNSWDEANLDSIMAGLGYTSLYSCQYVDNQVPAAIWGTVSPYYEYNQDNPYASPTQRYSHHKVCIWPSRPTTSTLQYRTVLHELGHVLGLGDDLDGDACLMKDGAGMLSPCTSELNTVRGIYNRW